MTNWKETGKEQGGAWMKFLEESWIKILEIFFLKETYKRNWHRIYLRNRKNNYGRSQDRFYGRICEWNKMEMKKIQEGNGNKFAKQLVDSQFLLRFIPIIYNYILSSIPTRGYILVVSQLLPVSGNFLIKVPSQLLTKLFPIASQFLPISLRIPP